MAALLWVVLAPAPPAWAQGGDLRLEVGGFRAFPPSGSRAEAASYAVAGLRADRWWRSGHALFGELYGGLAAGGDGGDWASALLGARGVLGAGRPVEAALTVTSYGFVVGEPLIYEALTAKGSVELRAPLGRVDLLLRGEGGVGGSTLEFRRGDAVRRFSTDLEMYGGGPEIRVHLGSATLAAGGAVLESQAGVYRRVDGSVTGTVGPVDWHGRIAVWDTPLGTEVSGGVALTVPVGPRLVASAQAGRTGPDPLVLSEPGAQGGLVIGIRLADFEERGAPALVRLTAEGGSGSGRSARFRLERERADSVFVLGDFSGWRPVAMREEGGVWTTELEIGPGTYHFGFLVDGTWFVPENAPGRVSDEWDQWNATLVVP